MYGGKKEKSIIFGQPYYYETLNFREDEIRHTWFYCNLPSLALVTVSTVIKLHLVRDQLPR